MVVCSFWFDSNFILLIVQVPSAASGVDASKHRRYFC